MSDYQGFKNWQTWNVALYLNNDQASYHAMQAYRRSLGKRANRDDAAAFVWRRMPEGTPDMQDDNPTNRRGFAAYRDVHWPSIAEVINESVG